MKRFAYIWNHGDIQVAEAPSVEKGFSALGFGNGALSALDFYQELSDAPQTEIEYPEFRQRGYWIAFGDKEEVIYAWTLSSALRRSAILAESKHGERGNYKEIG